jgi:hypothetical protein
MNLQQLIELAILDAMGLLDEDEQRSFESAFRGASPPVQAQVRREQTRLSRIEALLPDVTPPAGLRAAVLEAVRREIVAAEAGRAVGDTLVPPMIKSRGASPIWRLASVGLLAACMVLAFATIRMYRDTQDIARNFEQGAVLDALRGLADDVIYNRDTQRVVFRPAPGRTGEASVFISPEWRDAKLFYKDLPATSEGSTLRLALIDENDNVVKVIKEFQSQPGLATEGDNKPVIVGRAELPGPSL